jgi:hypothetical protein
MAVLPGLVNVGVIEMSDGAAAIGAMGVVAL